MAKATTLILGIGNVLMTDDGIGPRVVRRLASVLAAPESRVFMDGGTLSFSLAGPIGEHPQLIVIDAATLDAGPGTMRLFEGVEMDQWLRTRARSVHEVGLADLMDMVRLTDALPVRRALIGIQPQTIDWGERLTPAVESAIPRIVRLVESILARWEAAVTSAID